MIMAAGRGEFFRSLLEGLERQPAQPGPWRPQPGPSGGRAGPCRPQPGPGGGRAGSWRPQPGPWRPQPGPWRPQPGPGGGRAGPWRPQPGPCRLQPGPGGGRAGSWRPQPGSGGGRPGPWRPQPGPWRPQPGPGGGRAGPWRPQPGPGGGRAGPWRPQPGPCRPQPGSGGGRAGPCRPQPGPSGGRAAGKRKTIGAPSPASGSHHSCPGPRTEEEETDFYQIKTSPSKGNVVERLPSEILIKILSYLDVSSLFCISHVSKLFHRLANDDVMWHKIYMSEFGTQMWKPRLVDDVTVKEGLMEVEDLSVGHWKRMYFRTVAGQEMNKWTRELRDISPYTGLPRQTEWVLRNLNVSWELTVCDCLGQESTLEQNRVYFFESSVIFRWNGGDLASYRHISSIQLHGVRKKVLKSSTVRKPGWRSLILKVDMKAQSACFIGKDRLIKLMHLRPGIIIGVWRGQSSVAFIMVTLHFHKLVEKSLLGSPVCPYSDPMERPPVYNSDPEFGLHGYTLHFVLHNTGTQIMSGHFCQLSCRTVQIQRGLVELKVIDRTNLSQHRSLSGNVKLPWKSEELQGSVENCCIMTLTLLDEFQKPFWCVSSPICIKMAKTSLSFDYSGEHFLMNYQNPDGQVKMKLVWLKEQKQFFLISLTVYVSVFKVNKHFSRDY